jgi:adenine-specific DNA-methyltransferase
MSTTIDKDALILDFFAGSATTAHAVLDLNKEDGGNRKFIMVQLPEKCDEKSEAYKAGFKTIADIGKERIRRVIAKIKKENNQSLFQNQLDLGFKSFKLDSSNFKIWNTEGISPEQEALEKQLELHINHINPDSSQEDILFEILLKAGYQLSGEIKKIELAGKNVYSVKEGTMLICLENELTKEVIKAMADRKPGRVICLDQGFANNDQLKTNAVQIMKSKGIDDFRTV